MKYILPSDRKKIEAEKVALMAKLRANSKAIGAAAELGDLSENSEFDEAKREQQQISEQMKVLDRYLSCSVIHPEDMDADMVTIGKRVTLVDDSGNERVYVIVSCMPHMEEISGASPFAKAMLGKRVGDEVEFPNDNGTFEIFAIDVVK